MRVQLVKTTVLSSVSICWTAKWRYSCNNRFQFLVLSAHQIPAECHHTTFISWDIHFKSPSLPFLLRCERGTWKEISFTFYSVNHKGMECHTTPRPFTERATPVQSGSLWGWQMWQETVSQTWVWMHKFSAQRVPPPCLTKHHGTASYSSSTRSNHHRDVRENLGANLVGLWADPRAVGISKTATMPPCGEIEYRSAKRSSFEDSSVWRKCSSQAYYLLPRKGGHHAPVSSTVLH